MSKPLSERTKVVVRNLPPTLTAEAFQATIDKHAGGAYNWVAYYPGKVSIKRTVLSRAFINFNNPEAVIDFKQKFDGHMFVSTRGTQYKCSVEYAMFQKVPSLNPKKLAMEGTIEKDPDYQAFVKALEEGPKAVPTAQAQLEAQEAAKSAEGSGPVVTALMAYLQQKYESVPFTGRRSSRAARKREGAKLASLLEEEQDTGRSSKSRSKSSTAAAEAEAATAAVSAATAAVAEAAAHAARSGKQQHVKRSSKQQVDVQQEPAAGAGSKKQAKASESKPSKADKLKHGKRAAAQETSTAAAAASVAPSKEEDAEAKRAAAAALAAASAANAAAAARKARVKAGHQVYTPGARAGGKLFAAALPKPSDSSVSASSTAVPAATGAPAALSSSSSAAGSSRSRSKASSDAAFPDSKAANAAQPIRHVASSTGKKAAPAGDNPGAAGSVSAPTVDVSKAAANDVAGSSGGRSGKGGKGKARAGSAGKEQHQQQLWLPKSGGAG